MANNEPANGGIGIAGALGITFVALKLAHAIAWPWIWVLSPFWIPCAVVIVVLVVLVIIVLIKASRG